MQVFFLSKSSALVVTILKAEQSGNLALIYIRQDFKKVPHSMNNF